MLGFPSYAPCKSGAFCTRSFFPRNQFSLLHYSMKNRTVFATLFIVLFFYLLFEGALWIFSNKGSISLHCDEIRTLISTNQSKWSEIYTTSFDKAVACRTQVCKETKIQDVLLSLQDSHKPRFFQTSYFIRLNSDGNIEKWFRSGEVVTTIPETRGEQRVVSLLQGKSRPICTQNWKIDGTTTRMTYLHDDFSEAETILLVRDADGRILGAIVSRFGD